MTTVEVNDNNNHSLSDYPSYRNEGGESDHAAIDFNSWDELTAFANESGGDICLFKQRAGHHFWFNCGSRSKPLSVDDFIADKGDNYSSICLHSFQDMLKENDWGNNTSDLRSRLLELAEMAEALDVCPDDQTVIIGYGRYYDTMDNNLMGYTIDVTTYAVGVLIPFEQDNN